MSIMYIYITFIRIVSHDNGNGNRRKFGSQIDMSKKCKRLWREAHVEVKMI